ncbi:Dynein heavy chain 6, axonemal [Phytophthora fragariae]|uniref:Dynein heavy chain 6, axonemal n=1 Tax=Phytophthora fragariae TaxID=53985 RepID=A0A6G0NNW5_9STRA|nr:Dynein heavy chain 6, axonemal [Phytophthora fragariae]
MERRQVKSPGKAARTRPPKLAGNSIYDLTLDATFEFDGGSGFGSSLPSNKPLQAVVGARAAMKSPMAVADDAVTDGHKFTFTAAEEYTSPKKIPVFPGTLRSPEKKIKPHRAKPPGQSSKHLLAASSAAKASEGVPAPSGISWEGDVGRPKREASPRRFLRATLARSFGGGEGEDDEEKAAANQRDQQPSLFMGHHDPATGTSSAVVADAAAEAAAASATAFLKTGEDAIAFFARNGSDSEIKFVHLNRAETGLVFRPYDLVVVAQDDVTPNEHFTMSSSGLVHVSAGSPSEFIALAEWMRQSTMFNVLTSLRFFKHYLVNKAFSLWCANVRFKLYCRQRKRLSAKLFLAKESFCVPLLQVKKVMSTELMGVVLLDLRAQKTYESSAFVEYQGTKRAEGSKQFEICIEKLQSIIQRVCSDVKNLTKTSNPQEDFLSDMTLSSMGTSQEKTKSIVAVKAEQQQRRRLFRRAAEEAGMIADFIRLIDCIAVESLVILAVQSCANFLCELNKVPRKTGLFETTIFFGEQSTIFSPTSEQIQHIVIAMTDDIVSTVNSVSRVLYLRPFAAYVGNAVADAPHVGSTITSSVAFGQIRKELVAKIASDYAEATEYVKIFDNVRPIYEYDKVWDLDEYSQHAHTVTTLKADMLQISTWEKELEKMRAGQTIGILHVESRKLKQTLIPMTTAKLDAMKGLVKDLARARCKTQLGEYKQRIQSLLQRPQHLKEFAGHVERVQNLKSKQKALAKNTNVVDELYRLLGTYGVRISSEDMVQLDDLRSVQEGYKEETEAVDAFVASRLGEMTQQLDANIQRLDEQVLQLHNQLQGGLFIDASHFEDPSVVKSELESVKQRLTQLDELSKQYTEYQTLFNLTPFKYLNLQATQEYFGTVDSLWTAVEKWNELYLGAMTSPFVEVNAEDLSKDVAVAFKDAYALHKKLSNDVTAVLKDRTADFKLKMPTILELGNPAMKDRHWEKIFKALRQPWYPGILFTLENLVAYDVLDMKDLVGEMSAAASGEAQIEASLLKIKHGWDQMEFTCVSHRDQNDVFILGSLEDILMLLEDNQVGLQTMMGSRFIMGVKDEVERWGKRLSLLSDTLDEWIACQRSWMYLETIFCAEDIQKQLPVEAQKFALVDKNWKSTMLRTKTDPSVIRSVEGGPELLDQFRMSNKLLEEIQKSLEDYLETKRMAFPRFYFLSNDELLEILSQTRDPRAVQPHLGKCFDAMKSVRFDDSPGAASNVVNAMVSGEGELVVFPNHVIAKGPVESWLTEVEKAMRASLYEDGMKALMNYPIEDAIDRKEWLFGYSAQMIILVDQVFWTRNVTEAIAQVESGSDPQAVGGFLQFSLKQIDGMVQLVRGSLTKLQRILMGAVITIDVHARDVVRSLADSNVSSLSDFEWTRQLRYYWEDDVKNFVARQTNTRFIYGYEYLGNSPRLVITPLTDICYMTLTGALHLRLGGAPAGPAGTGKTETTKDLAKALAVQCVVFNCSDGLDYKIMGRFFSGLAQAGAWACFDEFNRIDIEVLSVIAQQVLCIQQAIVADVDEFEFEGNLIRLNTGFGVFITMNPGYAGRTELPDNLKALFRPVAMMVPDYRLIAEIVLFSEGFANALPLSHKMTQLYYLSSEQLSKQDHYDFGMRAVKSVLVAAGQLKRKEPEMHEDLLLIRAMRDSNVPKFLEQDLPLFRGIIADLFPGVVVPFVDYGLLQKAIEQQLDLLHLQQVPSFITKAIQVHETQLVRHGMMLVGEAGSGKSTNCYVLARALTQLYQDGVVDRDGFYKEVQRLTLNPKSISAGQLYGEFNLLTNEWTDGLVPKLVRQCVQEAAESDNRNWVVFDGPVDAVWIENMNTVLDDNKTLCLSNSERIKLPHTLHMMFEVQDLRVASPATVSRCGMVYMEQVHVGMASLARTWKVTTLEPILSTFPELCDMLLLLIETHVPVAIAFVRENCREKVPSNNHNLMQSCLNLLASCLASGVVQNAGANNLAGLVRMYFVFAVTWSVGANIDDASRPKFNDLCMGQFRSLIDSSHDACSQLIEEKIKVSWPPSRFENILYGDYLTQTEEIVGNLKSSLTELQPVLVQAQKDTAILLEQVAKDQAEADKQQQLIQADVEAANKIADEVKVIKDDCQKDLDEAMPAYYASIKALSQLKKDDITVLKTFTNPPRLVGVTMNAVCLLFGSKQEWNEAKKLLNDMKFLDKLKEFDKDNIPPKTIRQLQKFITDEEFTPETLSSISTAATSLCMWVRAMYTYDTVAKNIAPKKENLKAAEQRLEEEQRQLDVKQSGLNAVLKKVADLKRTLEEAQQKKIDLEKQSQKTQAQLVRAERLIDSLGEEQGRWKECAENLAKDMINLVGDMILSAGCIAYLGPFTSEYRHELQAKWDITMSMFVNVCRGLFEKDKIIYAFMIASSILLHRGMQQVRLYLEEQEEVPYLTLNVMVADISYGGRITDRWDKRTNSSIMRKLFCKGVMDDSYQFTASELYYAPVEGSLVNVREYVSSLPTADAPDIFGLHANADITFQQKETSQLLGTILRMLGGGGDSGGGGAAQSNDSIVMEMVVAIQERMPDTFMESKAHPATFQEAAGGSRNSLGVFLSQEMIRFNVLIQVMKTTLEMLKRAIKGLVVISEAIVLT